MQENVKLKETLKQNNMAMKQQFNTLAAWQEEIGKVHQSHKQKFNETKELISQLRKENSELKTRASQEIPSFDHSAKVKELEALLAEKTIRLGREAELEESKSELSKELEDSKTACKVLVSDVHRHKVLAARLDQQLKQAHLAIEGFKLDIERLELRLKEKEQLASLANFSLISMSSKQAEDYDKLREKSSHQDKEIAHLRELVTSLEQQLNYTSQKVRDIRSDDSIDLIKCFLPFLSLSRPSKSRLGITPTECRPRIDYSSSKTSRSITRY